MSLNAAAVMWRRGSMADNQTEMHKMVAEKFAVLPEVALAVWADTLRQATRLALTGGKKHSLTQMNLAALRPIAKRVKANKRRLGKRAT